MKSYLFIESRGSQESPDVGSLFDLAGQLAEAGHRVTIYLIQNAVLGCRYPRGVEVWADELSLTARGLDAPSGVHIGGIPQLMQMLMTPNVIPVWH